MKEFLKKLVNRGAPKCVPFLLLLTVVGVLGMARARPVEAAETFTAYSWDTIKAFKNKMANGKDENGYKLSSYGAEFNYSSPKLYVKGRDPINLKERVGKKNRFCRYWFWVKGNKMKTNSLGWATEYFIATREPLKPKTSISGYGPAYNTAQYPNDKVKVERLEARKGGFFQSVGKKVEHKSGEYWQLSFYVIDLAKWLDETNKDPDKFSGSVYLHTVAAIYDGGKKISKDLTTMQQWINATNGWNESGRHTYKDHYNQKLDVAIHTKHTMYVYRLHTSKDHPVQGDFGNGKIGKESLFKYKAAKDPVEVPTRAGSIVKLKNIRKFYDKDGKTYYLKGIRQYWLDDDDGAEHPNGKFFIYDNLTKNPIVGTTKKTNDYTKVANDLEHRDTISKREMDYTRSYTKTLGDGKNVKTSASEIRDHDSIQTLTNSNGLTTAKTWDDLSQYMADMWWKSNLSDNNLYLIYQELPQGSVKLNKLTYSYSDETGQYENNGNTKSTTFTLKKGTTSYSIAKLNQEHKGVAPNHLTNYGVNYYAKWVHFNYTDKNGKEHETKKLNLADYPIGGKKYDIYSGMNSEKDAINDAVTKMFKDVKMSNLNQYSNITISIGYYQPKTPTATVGYYRFYDDDGKPQTVKVFEQIDEEPSSVNSGKIGKSGTTYDKGCYLGYASLSRKIAVGKVGGQWVQVTDENKGQATDVRIVPLVSNGAYTTEVKGYHGAEDNEWDKKDLSKLTVNKSSAWNDTDQADDVPYFAEGKAKDLTGPDDKGRTIVNYPTKFKGNVVVAIYGEKIASYTVNIYAGTSFDEVTLAAEVQWFNVHSETMSVNTKVPDSPEGITRWVNLGATLADMQVQSPPTNADKYKYRPDLTTYTGKLDLVKSGPPKDKSGSQTTLVWEKGSSDSIELNYYYLKPGDTITTTTPPPPKEDKTTVETSWDDLKGTNFQGKGGPLYDTDTYCSMDGKIAAEKIITENLNKDKLAVANGDDITLPNGKKDWPSGKYTSNTLKNKGRVSSYLSQGSVKKHRNSVTFKIYTSRTVEHVYPHVDSKGNRYYTYDYTTQNANFDVKAETIYFQMKDVAVWRPELMTVYNYAFSQKNGGAAGDVRTPSIPWGDEYDYYSNLIKHVNDWGAVDWGKVTFDQSKYEVNLDALSDLEYTAPMEI